MVMVQDKPTSKASNGGRGLMKGIAFIRLLRQLSADMPMQQAEILLHIATYPSGAPMSDLEKKIGISQPSVSRNIAALSKFHRLGKPGLGLVEAIIDPREPRKRLVLLTTEGKVFMTKLIRTLDEEFAIDASTDAQVEIDRAYEEAKREAADQGKTRGKISPLPKK